MQHVSLEIRNLSGVKLQIECDSSALIAELKEKVAVSLSVPKNEVVLLFHGKKLEESKNISEEGINLVK